MNNLIKSVIKKEKEDSRTQGFLSSFTQQTGYVQSLTHNKDFTKNDQTDQVYNTCPQQEYTAHRNKPLLNLQQTKKPHRVHCVFQEHPY